MTSTSPLPPPPANWPYSFSEEDYNEDWLKTLNWDFQHPDGSFIDTMDDLFHITHHPPTQADVNRVKSFTKLPAWLPAPQTLKTEVARWLMEWDHPGAERSMADGSLGWASG